MPTFIKAGFWEKARKGYKEWLNLDELIESKIPTTTSTTTTLAPYKVYTALLTQTGTNAPVATVLENTLGVNVTFSYDLVGQYFLFAVGALTVNKTFVTFNYINSNGQTVTYNGKSINAFTIITRLGNGSTANNVLNLTEIEIRVYN